MRTLLSLLLAILMLGSGFTSIAAQGRDGVTTLTGGITITNPNILSDVSEPYMLLTDMTPYVNRDRDEPVPLESQIIGAIDGDLAKGASFTLHLPIAPQGTINDLARRRGDGSGVQIYSVEFSANSLGDPFQSPEEFTGWGTALSSLVVQLGTGEVIGGQVVIWAPDDKELAPTGLGKDGRFLTRDDPVGPVEAGWTVLDLNEEPFKQIRSDETEITIVKGDDGFTDYGDLSYTDAFDTLLAQLELRYPYTELKGIDWEEMRATFRPRVEKAQGSKDEEVFQETMYEFALAFGDGHVGSEPPENFIDSHVGGRLGMRLAETETGEVIVISVTDGLPADKAGIRVGAIVSRWNDRPIEQAIADEPVIIPASTDTARRLDQVRFLTRGPLDERVSVTYQNPRGQEETAELTFSEDIDNRDALAELSLGLGLADPADLPIVSNILPNGIGYIRVGTFSADTILMSTAWDYAIQQMKDLGAVGLIVDVRGNGGGFGTSALYLAGSFYDRSFELYREVLVDAQGEQIDVGGENVEPSPVQWDLPVAVLINTDCASACELFVAAMAENPDHLIVGYTPTAGVEGGVYAWNMPGDFQFQAPLLWPVRDGRTFLEGRGVPPNVEVSKTMENLLDPSDAVLVGAVQALVPQIIATLQEQGTPVPEATPTP
jgi:C-terminal processing protease CtpA/Prc